VDHGYAKSRRKKGKEKLSNDITNITKGLSNEPGGRIDIPRNPNLLDTAMAQLLKGALKLLLHGGWLQYTTRVREHDDVATLALIKASKRAHNDVAIVAC